MRNLLFLLLASSLFLSACASVPKQESQESLPAPAMLEALPTEVGSFEYEAYRYFTNASDGYTFRYTNPRKHRMADVYVYQVAEENEGLEHDALVMGSTRATMQAINEAVQQGLYANLNVVGAATQARGFRTVARVEATYLRKNLASYTLLYQTEYNGTLVKIRISMPDNESNRDSEEWDDFANTMINAVVTELDEKQKTKTTKKKKVEATT